MKHLRRALLVLAVLVVGAAGYLGITMWASLPSLDGTVMLAGLADTATVSSDRMGIPTIRASSREDALRALGYVTARDRLFQMDLLRRKSAGRLAEIFGRELLDNDTRQRLYGLPRAASAILVRLPATERAALDAYAGGVNGYLRSVGTLPFEFRLLRYRPEPWRTEDSLLVVLGMFEALSGSEDQERTRTVLARCLPPNVAEFLSPDTDRYTKALLGTHAHESGPLPVEELRALAARASRERASNTELLSPRAGEAPVGSNGWAVAGSRTRDGRAILANDMHLDLGVPNVWYRAELRYGDTQLAGVVLPGVPAVVAGTNGHVAWGLTNLEGDVLMDLVPLEGSPERPDEYRTPSGWKRIDIGEETIAVRGEPAVTANVRTTMWGPVSSQPLLGRPVAVRWAALDPHAVNLGVLDMDRVRTLDEAIAVMNRAGGPANNVLLADRSGRVAWTLTGRIPRRRGFDGSISVSWAEGRTGWEGYLAPAELPRLIDPASGFVVNANQRMPLEEGAPVLGHDFAHGYRAYRITERLRGMHAVTEADLLGLQLDTRTEFFDFYRDLALGVLSDAATASRPALTEARRALSAWDGRAEVSSPGLALLTRFRRVLADELFATWLSGCRAADPGFQFSLADIDTPLQRVLDEKSPQLVPAPARDWDGFLLAALEKAMAEVRRRHGDRPIDQLEWGAVSRVRIKHPLGGAIAGLGWALNMPADPLPGCGFCVRLAAGTFGASERLVVSPGHEPDGILHMPAGQSGHPLSAHYSDHQRAWVEGSPLPFLAGAAVHTLTLVPERSAHTTN